MATGLDMFDAVKAAAESLPTGGVLTINEADAHDLTKLTQGDLITRGFSQEHARHVCAELAEGRFEALAEALGTSIRIVDHVKNLIPGEGVRRIRERWVDDGKTLEEVLSELDQIRHPERYPL
ncbi:MAG TPA: hypothetical protein VGZ22_06665 [Isosphaeraceae bacterium]|jgi:hypothetical protein|nr:hypothetical protein [Isosphaeraceae bacterium]